MNLSYSAQLVQEYFANLIAILEIAGMRITICPFGNLKISKLKFMSSKGSSWQFPKLRISSWQFPKLKISSWLQFKFVVLLVAVLAFVDASADIQIPKLSGPVIDEAGIINAKVAGRISSQIRQVNESGAAQIQVYVVKSLGDLTIEQASIQIVDKWQLGTAKQDNGVLFLVAPNERKMRIEVGQGLEGDLPDIHAKRIIEDVVAPYFREGDYSSGIEQGVNGIVQFVAPQIEKVSGESSAPYSGQRQSRSDGKVSLGKIILWVILFLMILPLSIFRSRRGRDSHWTSGGGYWGGGMGGGGWGGSSGGGGWSGGGGGFSGGGASGGW